MSIKKDSKQNNKISSGKTMDMVDYKVAIPALVLMAAVLIWVIADGENVAVDMANITNVIADKFGVIYLVTGIFVLAIAVFVGFSKFGDIRLGKDDEKPEYSNLEYFAIIFAGGYGVGLTLWGLAEPLMISQSSVWGFEAGSAEMMEKGLSYAFLHWGWIPWAMYGIFAIMYGYYMFRKDMAPRFTMPLKSLVGEKHYNSTWMSILDSFVLFSMMGGLLPMTGITVDLIATGLNLRFGIETSTIIYAILCILIISIFTWSAVKGIKEGIAKLSKINIFVALGIAVFIFITTDPQFISEMGLAAFGDMMQNFPKMSTWADPVNRGMFPQGWTIIYWIWWLANAFMMGIIMATVARGRTLRQVVIPLVFLSPIASFFWFSCFSGGAWASDLTGATDYVGLLGEIGKEGLAFQFLRDLPLGEIISVIYIVLIGTFGITTLDSACLTFAQISTKKEEFEKADGQIEPPARMRVIWCMAMGAVAFCMLIANVEFAGVQSIGAITTLPLIALLFIMTYAFIKDLYNETNNKNKK